MPNDNMESENYSQCSNQSDSNMNIASCSKNLFLKMGSFNNGDESYGQDNSRTTLTFKMQLVINKIKPYLSSIEDLPNLIKRLNDLGVECIDDLKLLDFENDLQGIIKVIQCRKLKLELSKDVTIDENIDTPSVELESSSLTQSNTLNRSPQFRRSITKSLETERKLEEQFPNTILNRESGSNAEHTPMSMLHDIYHLKRDRSLEKRQQNNSNPLETSIQKKFRFATELERYAPTLQLDKETISIQDQKKTWLKTMYIVHFVTNVSNRNEISWSKIINFMKDTYTNQRAMIVNSEPINKILMEWPFLGKAVNFKNHFYYLINKEETVINKFNRKIPIILKFIQAEAEKKRKNKDLQLKLMAIMKKKNDTNELLTIILFYMSIMKEDADLMFISFKDTNALDELQSNISSTRPVVTCLGDKWTNPQCFVFVDKQCLWEHEPLTIQEAIQIMFMSYYVFNINYPKELAGILQFIQSCMFDINVEGNKVNRRIFNDKFVPKLLKCMKEYNDYVLKWSN